MESDEFAISEGLEHFLNDYDSSGEPDWRHLPEFCENSCCNGGDKLPTEK